MAPAADLRQQVGSYRLVRKIGEGGMGAVYEAVHSRIGKRAAIKMLHPSKTGPGPRGMPGIIERFFNEACSVNAVQHPSIVNIYEHGHTDDGAPYLVMDYLEGETLRERLRRHKGRLPHEALLLGRQITAAMAAAHEKGVIHRDLKPDNIILVHDPEAASGKRVKILDFGLAKLASDYGGPRAELPHATGTGQTMGTPTYMSPEQCRGLSELSGKTDVYAVGVILFEMVAGRPPFISQSAGELWGMHLYQAPPQLAELNPQVRPGLAKLVDRMLAKDPEQRPTMAEAMSALEALGAPRLSHPALSLQQPQVVMPAQSTSPALPGGTLHGALTRLSPGPLLTRVNTAVSAVPLRWRLPGLVGGALLVVMGLGAVLVLSATSRVSPPAPSAPVAAPRPSPLPPAPRAGPNEPGVEPPAAADAPAPASAAESVRTRPTHPSRSRHRHPLIRLE